MKTFNLDDLGVREMDNKSLTQTTGGDVSPWWSVASIMIQVGLEVWREYKNAYIKFSAETGGQYVIHHAY